jgi:hypothetical protein
MSKKLSKSRKRVHHRHRSQSSAVATLFTFPKLAIYGFIILMMMFLYQISVPSHDVKGVVTLSEDKFYTTAEVKTLVGQKNVKINWFNFVATTLWKDTNSDGSSNGEACLGKDYTFKIYDKNGRLLKTKTKKADYNCEPTYSYLKDGDNCHYVQFVRTETSNSYKLVSIKYSDSTHSNTSLVGKNLPKDKKVKVCGYPAYRGGDQQRYNEVDFGVKQ